MNVHLALITGATGGLGKALAQALAKKKVPLLLTATKNDALQQLAEELRIETHVEYYAADLAIPASREKILTLIRKQAPDLVINNAGFGLYGDSLGYSNASHIKLVDVNVLAVMDITLEVARTLIARNSTGTILNVSSSAGFFSMPYHASYCASKAFVNQFTCAFSKEVASHGIRIIVSCPGQMDTPFRTRASGGHFSGKDGHDIAPSKAAEEILQQIETGPTLRVIDRFYRIVVAISRLLPRSLVENHLARTIQRRMQSRKL